MTVFRRDRQPFFDDRGNPLAGGLLYIGSPNQNPELNPATITDDAGNPLAQPVVLNTYGLTPYRVNVAITSYSYRTTTASGVVVEDEPLTYATPIDAADVQQTINDAVAGATTEAEGFRDEAEGFKDEAEAAAASATGALRYQGGFDASSGSFPIDPITGDYYKITTAGTIDGQEHNVNDAIIYNGGTASQSSSWDLIDNTELDHDTLTFGLVSGSTYTLDDDDNGKVLRVTAGSSVTITLADAASVGTQVGIKVLGISPVSFVTQTDTLYNVDGHASMGGQYSFAVVYKDSGGTWQLDGRTA